MKFKESRESLSKILIASVPLESSPLRLSGPEPARGPFDQGSNQKSQL